MKFFFITITIALFAGCHSLQTTPHKANNTPDPTEKTVTNVETNTPVSAQILDFSGPPTFVYKTKADYSQNVPVTLSDDKTQIVSYPSPQDIYTNGQLATPTPLSNGYLLDNRGIGANVAFLKMTYTEYSKLKEAPLLKTMYSQIIDKDPLTELCNCGNRLQYANSAAIDNLIKGQLKKCKRIK
jgi:ABC-type Fe3+-hydroxamate transport system substrate-binding protein